MFQHRKMALYKEIGHISEYGSQLHENSERTALHVMKFSIRHMTLKHKIHFSKEKTV